MTHHTNNPLLAGRIALVTGAGQGNGRAIALGLAAAGARVIVTDVNNATVHETAELIRQDGGEAWAFLLDVTSSDACLALARSVRAEIGAVDIIVNNAGIIIREGIDSERAVENWQKVIDVNLNGTFNVTYAWLDALKETRGTVINVGSIASFVGVADTLGYSPSKGGVKMLTQALARELSSYGVRVNAIAPGVIETPMTEATRNNPQRLLGFLSRTPAGRVGTPEELIGPVVFLASSMSSYINGVTLPVDGGFLAA